MDKEFELAGKHIDTLIALVERGPLCDDNIPSKTGRDDLIEAGLAARVVYRGIDGYTAATNSGSDTYKKRYEATNLNEAITNRKTKQLMSKLIVKY